MNYPSHLLSKQTLDGHQLSQKMTLVVPIKWDSSFTTFIKRHNSIYQIFWDTLPPQTKINNFPWHPIKSLFQVNKYEKQSLLLVVNYFHKKPITDVWLGCEYTSIVSSYPTANLFPRKVICPLPLPSQKNLKKLFTLPAPLDTSTTALLCIFSSILTVAGQIKRLQ